MERQWTPRRSLAAGLTLLIFAIVLIGIGTYFGQQGLDRADRLVSIYGLVLGSISLPISALSSWVAFVEVRRSRFAAVNQAGRERVLEGLATVVQSQWRSEEKLRRLQDPAPIPIRWANADPVIMDHWENIHGSSGGSGHRELSGRLDQIIEVFERVPSRRLVVLGSPGAGKTVLCIRFTLDRLARRRPIGPVPVIFSLALWDPTEQNLTRWMADRLARDYPMLGAATADRSTLAQQLITAGLVLPVLDGFDEIAAPLRIEAIRALTLDIHGGVGL